MYSFHKYQLIGVPGSVNDNVSYFMAFSGGRKTQLNNQTSDA